jgi:hypothetical protein
MEHCVARQYTDVIVVFVSSRRQCARITINSTGESAALLPKQSLPVERIVSVPENIHTKGVWPQMTCECRTNPDESRTYWCVTGKSFYNTGQPC